MDLGQIPPQDSWAWVMGAIMGMGILEQVLPHPPHPLLSTYSPVIHVFREFFRISETVFISANFDVR
jgi:hypothetical protein